MVVEVVIITALWIAGSIPTVVGGRVPGSLHLSQSGTPRSSGDA
jgi:hypothetical protein